MKHVAMRFVLALGWVSATALAGLAQPPKVYVAQFVHAPPVIDGLETSMDEWSSASAAGDAFSQLGSGEIDLTNNRFDMLWDTTGMYIRHQVEHDGWETRGTSIWDPGYENLNFFFDPNTDDEPNENTEVFGTSIDGYQLAFNQPTGFSEISPASSSAGMYSESHVNNLFFDQGGPWSNFAGLQMQQTTSVTESTGYTELFIPWEDFDATDPADGHSPAVDDVGLYHPMPPVEGSEWYFNVGRVQTNGLIPNWETPSGTFFMADRPHGILQFSGGSDPCDLNGDQACNDLDIDAIATAVFEGSTNALFDIDGNGSVEDADRVYYVETTLNTYMGDSNLDAQFDSGDLVFVLVVGGYEDGVDGNATWASGDWNGDFDFDSGDLVTALVAGGFEIGPRQPPLGAVSAVPEPASLGIALGSILGLLVHRRRAHRRRLHR